MMELKSLEITEEEKKALQEYCEWRHTSINLLTSGDINTVRKLYNPQLDIFSKENFEKTMDTLKKVYSAMCKYSYYENSSNFRISRGTTVAEMKYLKRTGECTKFLSTSTNEETAKSFACSEILFSDDENDRKSALLRLTAKGNIPYIDVNAVLKDEENGHPREKEIILSPFTNINFTNTNNQEYTSHWNGLYYYDADIEAQELSPVENMGELENDIFDDIGNIPEYLKQYSQYKNKLEWAIGHQKYCENKEDREAVEDAKDESMQNIEEAEEKFKSIRQKIVQYAKGICYEARESVMEEVKDETEGVRKNLYEKHYALTKDLSRLSEIIQNTTEKLKKRTDDYQAIASKLGISWRPKTAMWDLGVNASNVRMGFDYINTNLGGSDENIVTQSEEYKIYGWKTSQIQQHVQKIEEQFENYSEKNFSHQLKVDLDKRLQGLITNEEIKRLDEQEEKLTKRKGNLFDKITGKEKETELRIEQLNLRKKLLAMKPASVKDDYSVHEMVASIHQYKDQDGRLPEGLAEFEKQIRSTFKIDDDQVKEQLRNMTMPMSLLPVEEKRTTIFNRRNTINRLQEENQRLKQDIQIIRRDGLQEYDLKNGQDIQLEEIPYSINRELSAIQNIIELPREQALRSMEINDQYTRKKGR